MGIIFVDVGNHENFHTAEFSTITVHSENCSHFWTVMMSYAKISSDYYNYYTYGAAIQQRACTHYSTACDHQHTFPACEGIMAAIRL